MLWVYVVDIGIFLSLFDYCAVLIDRIINSNINGIVNIFILIVNNIILKYPLLLPFNNLGFVRFSIVLPGRDMIEINTPASIIKDKTNISLSLDN